MSGECDICGQRGCVEKNHCLFVGDSDHGDTVPPTTDEILMRVTQHRDSLYAEVCRLETRLNELIRQRDEARQEMCDIISEIDCRIEHGADSNGHLEGIRDLFKENTND